MLDPKSVRKLLYKNVGKGRLVNRFLIGVNILFLVLLFAEFLFPQETWLRATEVLFGTIFIIEYVLRAYASNRPYRGVFGWHRMLDLLIIVTIFWRFGLADGDMVWLHTVGALRILRFYRTINQVVRGKDFLPRKREIIISATNLLVFIFLMTSMVLIVESPANDQINTYLDALYFTISTLTTTGFGDITVESEVGKGLVILIMIFGVALFLRLATSIFRPHKIGVRCKHCGLNWHDRDASHCKHCGNIINIANDGEVT